MLSDLQQPVKHFKMERLCPQLLVPEFHLSCVGKGNLNQKRSASGLEEGVELIVCCSVFSCVFVRGIWDWSLMMLTNPAIIRGNCMFQHPHSSRAIISHTNLDLIIMANKALIKSLSPPHDLTADQNVTNNKMPRGWNNN